MKDISTVGASISIKCPALGSNGFILIDEFSDEGTPFDCPDVDLSENAKNLNGEMISSRKPSVYSVSVTVIPGTDQDRELAKLFHKSALYKGNVTPIADLIVSSLTINIPKIDGSGEDVVSTRKYTFSNGRAKTGPTGPSSSAEGRQAARTYNFEFQDYNPEW